MENIQETSTLPKSDAEWYFRKDEESDRYYTIFFQMCRKFGISWAKATKKEKYFVEEVTRVNYERDRAARLGLPLSDIRPAFSSKTSTNSAEAGAN
ncbi:MAG: hypothetical protein LUG57_03505 [Oscillospiraceae bacterium]|nr:hypothetical protein [Oscillospiraceae bacterium]